MAIILFPKKFEKKLNRDLHRAIRNNDTGTAVKLIEKAVKTGMTGALDMPIKDEKPGAFKETPMMYSLRVGDFAAARALVKAGADVNKANEKFETPIKWLAARSASNEQFDKEPQPHLTFDAGYQWQYRETLDVLLKADVKAEDMNDALITAAGNGSEYFCDRLLEKGADINAHTYNGGDTALILAVENGHKNIAERLIKAGADVNAESKGCLPEFNMNNHADYILAGGDGCMSYYDGKTAVMAAARKGDVEMFDVLVNAGANVHAFTDAGESVLTIAAQGVRDYDDIYRKEGGATNEGNHEICKRLIGMGVEDVKDLSGKKAEDYLPAVKEYAAAKSSLPENKYAAAGTIQRGSMYAAAGQQNGGMYAGASFKQRGGRW